MKWKRKEKERTGKKRIILYNISNYAIANMQMPYIHKIGISKYQNKSIQHVPNKARNLIPHQKVIFIENLTKKSEN
jgi:hypothetical protein